MFCDIYKVTKVLFIFVNIQALSSEVRKILKTVPYAALLYNYMHIVHSNKMYFLHWCVNVFQVFTCDNPGAFQSIYSPNSEDKKKKLETLADQLVTLCATLDEYPGVRYKK